MDRIFNISEDGKVELNIENIEESYLESVFYNNENLIKNGSVSFWEYYRVLMLRRDLQEKRFIDDIFMKNQAGNLKKDLFSFYNKVLKPISMAEVDETSSEDIDYILDEYEKISEHQFVCSLIRNGLMDDDSIDTLDEKVKELSRINSEENMDVIKALTLYGYTMTMAVLKNKNFDEYINGLVVEGSSQTRNRNINIKYKYQLLREEASVEEIEKAKNVLLEYKKKFKIKSLDDVLGDFVIFEDFLMTRDLIENEREVFQIIERREKEYEEDLLEEEKRAQREAEEKKRREEEKKQEEKRKAYEKKQKEFEKYSNFEDNGTYGPKEVVIPIAINYFMKEGKFFSEILTEEEQKSIFDKIKSLPLKKNERVALVVFSDLKKEDALRVLEDLRDVAEKNGVSKRVIEGITTEFGEELLFDEKNSRKLNRRYGTKGNLDLIREDIKEHIPKLVDDDPELTYLKYSYDSMTEKQFEKADKRLKDYFPMAAFLKVPDRNMFIGIPREKMFNKVRKNVAKYLNLKYLIDPKFLDAFSDSKKLDEYGIDKSDDEGR